MREASRSLSVGQASLGGRVAARPHRVGTSQSCRAEGRAGSEMPSVFSPGFMLIGSDVKLNSPSSLIGQALTEILQHPERARDALRVLLHLVSPTVPRGPLPSRAGCSLSCLQGT